MKSHLLRRCYVKLAQRDSGSDYVNQSSSARPRDLESEVGDIQYTSLSFHIISTANRVFFLALLPFSACRVVSQTGITHST